MNDALGCEKRGLSPFFAIDPCRIRRNADIEENGK